jgi:predicted nucleic acid-binding protein
MPPATNRRHATVSQPVADVVIDASAVVDLLLGGELGEAVGRRIAGQALHAPAHADAEILSALGRLQRAGAIEPAAVEIMLGRLVAAPIRRHPVTNVLPGAWARRHQLRLADAIYVELAVSHGMRLLTTDRRLRPVPVAEVVVS